MNFMKYPTKNDISISNAVLKLAKLQNAERLELTAATGAVIVTSGRMTAKELLSTVQSLTGRAAELMLPAWRRWITSGICSRRLCTQTVHTPRRSCSKWQNGWRSLRTCWTGLNKHRRKSRCGWNKPTEQFA